ncbi:heat shock protein 30-like [Conger conger]|uniref:heat shock protein 30-like n=1 Tax=Conger conger TaxID=82655 RepID=UPI002A5B0BFA|nr:heat shock protein 30-like [Conger conger]
MLCSHVFQPSFSHLVDFHWPVRSLWPQTRPLCFQEEMLHRHMQEMKNSLGLLHTLQHRIFQEMDQVPASQTIQPVSYKQEKEGDHFVLTLDTQEFTPGDLCVKQVGRKLRVCGKTEKKQEDGKGSYSYKRQEFRQEFDLPEGVNPNAVTCSLLDGQLRIQAPTEALSEGAQRAEPIHCSPGEKTLQIQSSQAEGSTEETQNHQ